MQSFISFSSTKCPRDYEPELLVEVAGERGVRPSALLPRVPEKSSFKSNTRNWNRVMTRIAR